MVLADGLWSDTHCSLQSTAQHSMEARGSERGRAGDWDSGTVDIDEERCGQEALVGDQVGGDEVALRLLLRVTRRAVADRLANYHHLRISRNTQHIHTRRTSRALRSMKRKEIYTIAEAVVKQ